MKRIAIFAVLTLGFSGFSNADTVLTGEVEYPYLGIKLTIPAGWKGAVEGEYLLLGSDSEVGIIGLTTNEASRVEELKQVADAGWYEDTIAMKRSGEFDRLGTSALGAEFTGTFDWEDAKAYIAGVVNPLGPGVTVIALTSADKYGPRQKALVAAIVDSIKFAKPKEAEHNDEWRAGLADRQLKYIYSSSSDDGIEYDPDGYAMVSYSFISDTKIITLCANQYFSYRSSSSTSFDAGYGFGSTSGGNNGDGEWEVATSDVGESLLRLNFNDGEVYEYKLEFRDGKTLLNGTRYFRTATDACY